MELCERLKLIRNKTNLSQEAFGEQIGITRSSVSLLESGKNNPSDQTILLVCKTFNVSAKWLLTGDGEMLTSPIRDAISALVAEKNMSPLEETILRSYMELPPHYREIVMDVTRRMAEAAGAIAEDERMRAAQSDADKLDRLIHSVDAEEKNA